ncbi:unnamed protein product [Rotaria magnacalcarata]|uniref:Endonuclease/exonuclease/phosphatase domain-containing protein n=2 Tax=Rotaria magnacalcarata TaxID=392030 RepID=A0A817A2K6_9BILA|nr:unnamed protein product [Rotaria magnacalcarata]
MRGVGFLLSTQAKKALIGYNPISSRIISARFDAAPFKISVIHVYAPTSSSSEEDIEAFYNDIEQALAKTDKKDVLILTGDWNAKIGNDNTDWKSVMGKYGYEDRNERGERLLEFATVHDFYVCNTKFQHKPNRQWTWASPDGIHKNMIDLILIQRRWKTSVTNCRTFQKYTQQYKGLCRKVKRSARQDKEHWIQDQCEQAEKGLNIGNTREAYGLIKMLRKEFVPRLNVIRNQEGTMLQTKDDIKRKWTQHCNSLYKDPGGGDGMVKELVDIAPPGDEVPQDILYSEVQTAINSLKRNKSPGSDGITAEML